MQWLTLCYYSGTPALLHKLRERLTEFKKCYKPLLGTVLSRVPGHAHIVLQNGTTQYYSYTPHWYDLKTSTAEPSRLAQPLYFEHALSLQKDMPSTLVSRCKLYEGCVYKEPEKESDILLRVALTDEESRAALKQIEATAKDPPTYHALLSNCISFAVAIGAVAGINLANYTEGYNPIPVENYARAMLNTLTAPQAKPGRARAAGDQDPFHRWSFLLDDRPCELTVAPYALDLLQKAGPTPVSPRGLPQPA